MEHDEGFVLGNHVRLAIIQEVASGEQSVTRITKKHRLIRPAVDRAVSELVERDVLRQTDDIVELTEAGVEIADKVRKLTGPG